jgi:hypothetical protein
MTKMFQPPTITAEAYLVTTSGKPLMDPDVIITADNVGEYRPAGATVAEATRLLRSLGFDVPMAGLTLTISGPLPLFEQVFQITFDTSGEYPRPIGVPKVPLSLRHLIEGIVFGTPARLFG